MTVIVLAQFPKIQQKEIRRIAFAATATALAAPTETVFVSHPTTTAITATPISVATEIASISNTPPLDNMPPRVALSPYQETYDFVNILILGSDRLSPTASYRTDVIIVAAINRTTQTIRLLSIPRDLYVYIPGWGMDRINTAELHQTQLPAGSHPLGLLAETIEYNLGIRIDHLARIDFEGFEFLVDAMGGLAIPVDCAVTGYQFSTETDDWIPFVLEPGLHQMNGSLALWYVRQRVESSDFDRNRRQQIFLRALWDKASFYDLLAVREFWNVLIPYLETDLTFEQILDFVPLLLNLDVAHVDSQFIGIEHVRQWQTPAGYSVLIFDLDDLDQILEDFFAPEIANQLGSEQAVVNVMNGSSIYHADQLAAAHLRWLGISANALGATPQQSATTLIFDHSGQLKGSSLSAIQQALNILPEQVSLAVNDGAADFTIVIGEDYESCLTKPWEPF